MIWRAQSPIIEHFASWEITQAPEFTLLRALPTSRVFNNSIEHSKSFLNCDFQFYLERQYRNSNRYKRIILKTSRWKYMNI
jgi:hypothetical protein